MFFVCACFYLIPFARSATVSDFAGDEGIYIEAASRIYRGDVMYRDFFYFTGPTTFYLLAGWFRIFGLTFFSVRLLSVLLAAATATLTCWLASRFVSKKLALLPGVLVLTSVYPAYAVADHHRWSVFFALAATCVLVAASGKSGLWYYVLAGAFVGAGMTCVQSTAIAVGGASVLYLLFQQCATTSKSVRIGGFIAGIAAVMGMVACYFWREDAFKDLMYDTITWVSERYTALGWQHFASLPHWILKTVLSNSFAERAEAILMLSFCLTSVSFAMAAALGTSLRAGATLLARRRMTDEGLVGLVSLGALATMATAFNSVHILHVAPVWVVAVMIWATQSPGNGHRSDRRRLSSNVLLGWFTLNFAAYGVYLLAGAIRSQRYPIEFARGTVRTGEPYIEAQGRRLRDFVDRVTAPADAIFVYPCGPYYYFLLDRVNPTRYNYIVPGFHTSKQVQEAIQTLERIRPVIFLRENQTLFYLQALFPMLGGKDDPILAYLRSHYSLKLELPPFIVSHYPRKGVLPAVEVWQRADNGENSHR